jgi:CRP-like cAMP-binding protein
MNITTLIDKLRLNPVSIFEGISHSDLTLVQKNTMRIEEEKNTLLFKEGFYPKGVYLLNKGMLKIYQVDKNGDNQIVDFYGAGEIVGYRPIISDEPNPVTAETLEGCVLSFIPKKYFLEVLHRSTLLSNRLLTTLSHEFTVWVNRVSIFTQQSIKENVALTLLMLDEKYGRSTKKGTPVVINLPRKDFANYVGTTVETLVRTLRILKDEKIISTKGRGIVITDKDKLAHKLGENFHA